MWRPTKYGAGGLRRLPRGDGRLAGRSGVIHAVYLINCATKDRELRKKSLASLTHALRIGDGIGAAGVVLHPGAQKGEPLGPSMKRAGEGDRRGARRQRALPAAARADRRPQGPARPRLRPDRGADRARRRRQAPRPLPRLLPPLRPGLRHHRRGAPRRRSSTKPTPRSASSASRCLHVNDAAAPLGSCRDRHANIGKGEMGKQGLAAFLSEPRFEGLPATLETPGPEQERPGPQRSPRREASAEKQASRPACARLALGAG